MFRDDMAVIDGVVIKGGHIGIPEVLQLQVLKQLHIYHMDIEKTKLLVCESVYWINKNVDIQNHIKIVLYALIFSKHNQKHFTHCDILGKLWEMIGVDMFTLINKTYLCIVDYHSKLPIVKKAEDLCTDNLMLICKII